MGFRLPLRGATVNTQVPVPELIRDGLTYKGTIYPYDDFDIVVNSDDESEWHFKDDRKPLIFRIEPGCAHQLPDMERFIENYYRQDGKAKFAADDDMRQRVLNMPKFDNSRITDPNASAMAIGG